MRPCMHCFTTLASKLPYNLLYQVNDDEMLITVILFRSQSIVNVVGKIRLSEQQITLEGNHSVCNLEGTQHKWYDLM